jgi:hypothetical protein
MTSASTPKGAVVRPLREGATRCGGRHHEEVCGLQETDAELRAAGGPQKAVRHRPPLTNLTLPLTRTPARTALAGRTKATRTMRLCAIANSARPPPRPPVQVVRQLREGAPGGHRPDPQDVRGLQGEDPELQHAAGPQEAVRLYVDLDHLKFTGLTQNLGQL